MVALHRLALVLVVLALGTLCGVGPAQAHSRLVSSDPAEGAALVQPPASATLVFSEALVELGAGAELTGPGGSVPVAIEVSGVSLVARWDGALAPGAYSLAWRVTSADGHPISGTLAFSVTGSATAEPVSSDEPTNRAIAPADTPSSSASALNSAGEPADDPGAGNSWLLLVVAAVAAAGAALGVVVWTRSRRT